MFPKVRYDAYMALLTDYYYRDKPLGLRLGQVFCNKFFPNLIVIMDDGSDLFYATDEAARLFIYDNLVDWNI